MKTNVKAAPEARGRATEKSTVASHTVEERLNGSSYLALRDLRFALNNGILTLWGRVPSHYHKQLAQALAVDIDGVNQVVNLIEVATKA
jgi:osmotically-inducible protein OsmY